MPLETTLAHLSCPQFRREAPSSERLVEVKGLLSQTATESSRIDLNFALALFSEISEMEKIKLILEGDHLTRLGEWVASDDRLALAVLKFSDLELKRTWRSLVIPCFLIAMITHHHEARVACIMSVWYFT